MTEQMTKAALHLHMSRLLVPREGCLLNVASTLASETASYHHTIPLALQPHRPVSAAVEEYEQPHVVFLTVTVCERKPVYASPVMWLLD